MGVGAGGAAVARTTPDTPDFPAGLANAAEPLGQQIAGVGNFFSTKLTAPDGGDRPEWNVSISIQPCVRVGINFFTRDAAGAFRTFARFELTPEGRITSLRDSGTGIDNPDFVDADLSRFIAPDVGDAVGQPPDGGDFPAGLAKAIERLGRNITGSGSFFSAKIVPPDTPDMPEWNLFFVDNPDFRVALNLFTRDAAGAARTFARIVVDGGTVTSLRDPSTGVDNPDYVDADLSGFVAPDSPDATR